MDAALQAAVEASSDAMLLLRVEEGRALRVVALNAAYRCLLSGAGAAADGLVGRVLERDGASMALPSVEAQRLVERCERALAERRPLEFDDSSMAPAGSGARADTVTPILGAQNQPSYVLCVSRGLTGGDGVLAQLAESEEKFSRAFQLSPAALSISSLKTGRFLDVNEACCNLFGYPREAFIGRNAVDLQLWHQNSDRDEFYRQLRESGKVRDLEIIIRTTRNERLTVLFSAEQLEARGEPCMVASIYDVTSRRHTERIQRQLEAQLRQTQKLEALGTLAGGIAHDFNNLLTVFAAAADLIAIDIKSPAKVREHLNDLRMATARSRALVQQVLTFSRKGAQLRKRLDLRGVVEDAVRMLNRGAPPSLEIQLSCPREPVVVFADADQMHQIVMNLGTNALQAMHSREGVITVRLDEAFATEERLKAVPGLNPGWHACLVVEDRGVGMDVRTISRIFEPFFTTKKPGEGTGLGLAVVYGIVQEHGGTLEVQSDEAQGTRVTAYLPLVGEGVVQAEAVPSNSVTRGSGEHVLVVDDEMPIAHACAGLLARIGYRVTVATDSVEALTRFTEDPAAFDLVLTDIAMPRMTGDQLTRALLELRGDLPVVLMTGYPAGWTPEAVRRPGACELLEKPIGLELLAAGVARALESAARGTATRPG